METWSFREEILRMISRWQILLLFVVVGGLLGYLGSVFFPTLTRAEADLYVGIDVRRVGEMAHVIPLAEKEPLNLEDYKNWQLKQVADIAASDSILEETLLVLRESDPAWENETLEEFRRRIDIYWYDAGNWHLQITHSNAKMAAQAVKAWREIAQNRLEELIANGEIAAQYENELRVLIEVMMDIKHEIAALAVFLDHAQEEQAALAELTLEDELDPETRLEILTWLENVRDDERNTWNPPLDTFPDQDAPVGDYLAWFEDALQSARDARASAEAEQALLAPERDQLLVQYHQAQDESLGLSANIQLELTSRKPRLEPVRSTGTVILVCGFLGLLIWLVISFLRIHGKESV
jgi:hypothetical protein